MEGRKESGGRGRKKIKAPGLVYGGEEGDCPLLFAVRLYLDFQQLAKRAVKNVLRCEFIPEKSQSISSRKNQTDKVNCPLLHFVARLCMAATPLPAFDLDRRFFAA